MSVYYTHVGHLKFENMSDFLMVVDDLTCKSWVSDGHFIDECGKKISDDANIHPETQEMDIPHYLYRNLSPYFLTRDCPVKGYLITTYTDGCMAGSVMEDGLTVEDVDLERWGKENVANLPDDVEMDDKYFDWVNDVENEYIACKLDCYT